MHNELTKNDIKKMEDEIEYRVQVVRKQALEDSVGHGWVRSFPGSIGRSVCLDGMGEKKVTEAQA